MSAVSAPRHDPEFPSQGTVLDAAGLPVDCFGWIWRLNHPVANRNALSFRRLSLSGPLLEAVAKYVAARIQLASVDDVRNTFETLAFLQQSEHLRECMSAGNVIGEHLLSDLRLLPNFSFWRLHYVRAWYRWCADARLPQFSRDVADRMDEVSIGGNEKGRAVMTRDPLEGAFDELEFVALTTRLRSEEASRDLDLSDRVLIWLAIAFGRNAIAYALMREDDYRPLAEHGTGRTYHRMRVPRTKKGSEDFRTDLVEEMLNDEIGGMVAGLVEDNKAFRAASGWPEGCAYPLFRRSTPRAELQGGPRHEYAMHLSSEDILAKLKRAVAKLGVISHRTGGPLRVNPRRFRRTFATRAVEEGASPVELATMLDHTDLQNVGVYFETRSSQVDRLDAAMAIALAPLADAFLGRIVDTEGDAVNGADPGKRIPWFRRVPGRHPERAGNLGTCGSGPCSLFAPLSCYTCDKFQPWKDGPHREMLDWLCAERDRKRNEGLDAQIVNIHDDTILAVAEVVRLCDGGVA